MSRTSGAATFVLIEEPENHLSYTSLARLITRIDALAGVEQQLFVTTHSSFVSNRLGLDRLVLLHDGQPAKLSNLGADTVAYFRKLAGYDTLRLVLARRLALVEGPSDAIVLERAFLDEVGKTPLEAGVDIISMGGLTFKRAFEVCACLDRDAVALQDNDGDTPDKVKASVAHLLSAGKRSLLVSDPTGGKTLEPQIIAVNDDALLRRALKVSAHADLLTWMTGDKTEAALRILDSAERIVFPDYITKAVALLQ
jgi:predicted ATP-dependent endonuclease of OLD family